MRKANGNIGDRVSDIHQVDLRAITALAGMVCRVALDHTELVPGRRADVQSQINIPSLLCGGSSTSSRPRKSVAQHPPTVEDDQQGHSDACMGGLKLHPKRACPRGTNSLPTSRPTTPMVSKVAQQEVRTSACPPTQRPNRPRRPAPPTGHDKTNPPYRRPDQENATTGQKKPAPHTPGENAFIKQFKKLRTAQVKRYA